MTTTHDINIEEFDVPQEVLEALALNEQLLTEWEELTASGRELYDWERVGSIAGEGMSAALGQDGFFVSRFSESKVQVMDEREDWVAEVHLNALDLFNVLVFRMLEVAPGHGAALVVAKLPCVDIFGLQAAVFGAVENALGKVTE